MSKKFQPCGLCGNCDLFRKAERDKEGNIIDRRHDSDYCAVDGKPIWIEPKFEGLRKVMRGHWMCDPFKPRSGKRKKIRGNKPWQREVK